MDNRSTPIQSPFAAQSSLREIADCAGMVMWMSDANDAFIYLNPGAAHPAPNLENLSLSSWIGFIHPDDMVRVAPLFRQARAARKEYKVEYRIVRSDGSVRWVMDCAAPRFSAGGEFLGYNGNMVDVTDRRETLALLTERDAGYRLLAENGSDMISHHALDGKLLYVSPSVRRVLGYEPKELIGTSLYDHVHPDDARIIRDAIFNQRMTGDESELIEFRKRHKDGRYVWMGTKARVLIDPVTMERIGTVAVTRDITFERQAKQAEARLEQLATRDILTGLPNRALLNERLQRMLDASGGDEPVAVVFIDLDRFKEINDSMGHDAGDLLLREVARRLQEHIGSGDVVARLGGDEFVIAARCPAGAEASAVLAERLLSVLAAPYNIASHEVFVSASIGISLYPRDGATREVLFQNADTAMYRAKATGRNGYCFFETEMSVAARTRMALEHALRRAPERNEFELHYQPRLNLKTMAIVGMEALIRWNHPELGQISPLQFIPLAEERGMIESIGQWVLKEACMQTRRLMNRFGRQLRVSVNLSARQLKCPHLLDQVESALRDASLPPHLLELELTESALIEDMDVSTGMLKDLRKLGIRLSVDDFGTGYSGLAYLRQFPLDTLKLDRSFVTQQSDGISSARFIKAFVDLAHALNLSVVAEGVETKEILQMLRAASCDEAQGYLFAAPLPCDELEAFFARLPNPEGKN